jgi:hypothetical protein
MAGSGKKRTTMAKLTRESRLRERRLDKRAKKDARKLAPAQDPFSSEDVLVSAGESDGAASAPAGPEPATQTHLDS